jgi:hypothetical protein
LASSNRSSSLTIIEKLVHYHRATQTEQPQLYTTNFQQHRAILIDDVQLIDLVLPRSEFLQYPHIFAGTPNCVNWYIELQASVQELW